MRRLLMLFVDGLGLAPPAGGRNPLTPALCPTLHALLAEARPVDARLGVPGLPQSATGQTAILTGLNAPLLMGRHIEGFPNPKLKTLIRAHNIFRRCRDLNLNATFANGYLAESLDAVRATRFQSVTTVAALSGLDRVRLRAALETGEAVSHDLVRDTLAQRGYKGPAIPIEQAAEDLCRVACTHHFTLFEFFMTDRAGHRRDHQQAEAVLQRLDRFLARLLPLVATAGITLALASDHGNIEDLSVATHTLNPVPWLACGPDADDLRQAVDDLTGIVPACLAYLNRPPHERAHVEQEQDDAR